MAIPASEQWTALFLPQLLFAADPERLHSRGPTPTALLIEDRIAARNREAVRLGVRRCMNAKEALLTNARPAARTLRTARWSGAFEHPAFYRPVIWCGAALAGS